MKNKIWIFLAVAFFVLLAQSPKPGFEPRDHHGWVASHGLAIASRANAQNGFLGYTCEFENKHGRSNYYYFDRYPAIFSAISHYLLSSFEHKSTQIVWSRHWMNLIYLLTMFFVFLTFKSLFCDDKKALVATLFCMSGRYFLEYKDMFHFDQPAVLGLAVLFWSWVRYYKLNDNTTVLWVSLLAPLMGRGYVSNFALVTWVLIELYGYLKRREGSIWRFVTHRSMLCCLLGGVVSTSALAYNLAMESKVRQVPLTETSIVISANKRLGFDEKREQGEYKDATWGNLARKLVNRVFVGLAPFVVRDVGLPSVHDIGVSLLWLVFFILLYRKRSLWKDVWKRSKEENGKLLLLMALSGLLWVVVIKRLIITHEYTAVFLLGFYMVFWFLVTQWVWQLWSKKSLIGVALAVFVLSVGAKRYFDDQFRDLVTQDTQDMEQILAKTPAGSRVFVEGGYSKLIKNAPYAPCYFFSEQIIVDQPDRAEFRITRQISDGNFGLTPNNKGIFLHHASDEK